MPGIPPWLAQITGAMQFANNPANSFQPTVGDAFQGIGHDMMEHFRAGSGQASPGTAANSPLPAQPTMAQLAGQQLQAPPNPANVRPTSGPINFVPPDLQALIMHSQAQPQVGTPTPLAGAGTPLGQMPNLFR